jgi:hypothetical protein
LSFTSCVKKEYDDIETFNVDPDLTITHSIQQLQAMASSTAPIKITDDIIIAGIVVGDDASGNIYKKIIIEDNNYGLAIQVDVTNFNTEYPIGRRIFVKCNGLYLGNNNGNFELGVNGGSAVGRIPANLLSTYIVKGKWGLSVTPLVFPISAANSGAVPTNTLVKFTDAQFESSASGVAWANGSSTNYNVEDCNGNQLVVYSSSYSTFALKNTPTGKGSISGIYSLYNGAGELQIRDLYDVDMNGSRCGINPNATLMPLDSIRMLDPGTGTINLPADRFIRVIVTTDLSTSMITGKNIYCQDMADGIQVRFTSNNSFPIGTELDIFIGGMELSSFHEVLQINNVPNSNAIPVLPTTFSVSPRNVTISDINANYNDWEGQLVKIDNVTISGTGVYSGSQTLTDGSSNTITLFTTSSATFAGNSYPTGPVSVTGILTEYDGTKEILIRDPANDVQ